MITRALLILNIAAFVWEVATMGPGMLSGDVAVRSLYEHGALVPAAVFQDHQWWRIVTGAFLHGSLIHIGVNMMSLWFLGRFVETIAGAWRMAAIYAVALVVSGLGVVYFSDPMTATVGASGAIFGLFGALFAMGLKLGKPGMDLIRANLGILVLNLFITFTIPEISKAAHVAGLLSGFVLTLAIYFSPRPIRASVVDANSGQALESTIELPNEREPRPFA